ncbi:CDP-glycerol glycerophosphotransferase family protein [uncultured Jatrophihabitans sp.]|uniref:CDP-glycerol glycerophosphotransferase family protein n=1 Tax=uncultured Jatrophihabitans sp. TaxID=1610747 RepID=UPI0035CBBB90
MRAGRALRMGRRHISRVVQSTSAVDPGAALFNSYDGSYSDSPRVLSEALAVGGATQRYWVAQHDAAGLPSDVRGVEPGTQRYARTLGRAGLVIANTYMSESFHKRDGVSYLQTWHGTPLKRIGWDNPQWDRSGPGFRWMTNDVAKWTYLLSQSSYCTQALRSAFRFDGEVLELGYPRNDVLNSAASAQIRHRLRKQLGASEHVSVTLWTPTWRDDSLSSARPDHHFPLDFERVHQALGNDHILLLRLHRNVSALRPELPSSVIDVSSYPDISELYLAADVLMTDYSSTMFDFAVTSKPQIFYMWDLARYRDIVRGFYFDIVEEAPGPIVRTTDEVIKAIHEATSERSTYAGAYDAFRQKYCPVDDGDATRRILSALGAQPSSRASESGKAGTDVRHS